MKQCLVGVVLVALAGAGLLRVHLVAKEFDEEFPVIEEAWDERIGELSARINDDDPRLQRFVDAIHTPAGAFMLREHAEWAAETVRQQARSQAVSHFIEEHFEEVGSELALRNGRDQFRDDFLQACHTFQTDVAHLAEAVRDIGRRLATDSEEERLVARFLQHDAGPTMLYAIELRQRLHPQERELEEILGDLFVRNASGQFTIRPARRAEAERMLQRVQEVHRAMEPLHAELAAWSDDIAPNDDLERQLKRTLRQPPFAKFIAAQMLLTDEEDHRPVDLFVDELFEELENMSEDTGDGLVVAAEARPEVEKWLRKSHAAVAMAGQLAGPVQEFAAQISTGQPLEEHWIEWMKSDLLLLRLANDFEVPNTDPSQAVRSLLGEVLVEDADGTFRLQEERTAEAVEFIRDMFRKYREVRRKGRRADELADRMSDGDLREAFRSMGGKFVIAHVIEKSLRQHAPDGLELWIEQHFERTDDGLSLREGAKEGIDQFVREAKELAQEFEPDGS